MTIWIGLDPGSISGAVGALDSNGDYLDSFMIEHKDKNILPLVFKNMILRCIDPREGAEICMESVHSMPGQGVASSFQFGRAVGVISAVAELTRLLGLLGSGNPQSAVFNSTTNFTSKDNK